MLRKKLLEIKVGTTARPRQLRRWAAFLLNGFLDLNVIYICLGCMVVLIFTLWLEGLIRPTSFRIIVAIAIVQFASAIVLHLTKTGPSAALLLAPFPTLVYFRLCRMGFLSIMHREPVNVACNWDSGLFLDRVFAFIFLGGAAAMLLFATELAKAGW